jgi:hypothetical protein
VIPITRASACFLYDHTPHARLFAWVWVGGGGAIMSYLVLVRHTGGQGVASPNISLQLGCTRHTIHKQTEIQQVDRGISLADTQTGRHGRLYLLKTTVRCDAATVAPLLLPLILPERRARSLMTIVTGIGTGLLPSVYVTVPRIKPIAGASSREHCPRVYTIGLST